MMSWPGSPRTRSRPIAPTSPIASVGLPRAFFAGAQVGEVGAMPLAGVDHRQPGRARRIEQAPGRRDGAAQQADIVAEHSPNPPGSRKSRCMSMISSAAVGRLEGEFVGLGVDQRHAGSPTAKAARGSVKQ